MKTCRASGATAALLLVGIKGRYFYRLRLRFCLHIQYNAFTCGTSCLSAFVYERTIYSNNETCTLDKKRSIQERIFLIQGFRRG